ncbi:MAG: aldose epimerase family protein [Clostridia bacterium]|nr:aldose epimerase family protein [Clostridia bacterium]
MSITKKEFGVLESETVYLFTLDNNKGLKAEIFNLGGTIRALYFNGTDVVQGYDTLDKYLIRSCYYGAIIGRYSNRIENSVFTINGKDYHLYANDGRNNLHGGKIGFDKKLWNAEMLDGEEPSLRLTLHSPDGDEGFPGNCDVTVTYTLTKGNALRIHYEGICDQDSAINMTNHSYFNLNGHDSGTIDNHTLELASDFYTPNCEECFPCGEVLSVKNTAFDLTTAKPLGECFKSNDEQVKMFNGFDHNFVLRGMGFRHCATLIGDKTGIKMDMCTDLPGVQIYTVNSNDDNFTCKNGAIYPVHSAICLETQTFPNGLKHTHYPNGFIKKGEKYDTVTEYKFSTTM